MVNLERREQINSAEFNLRSGSFQLSLRFAPDAFATLGHEIGASYVSVPKHPAEAGGLLTGEIVQNNSDWIVTIQDVTPISIQYQYGPSYRLSAAEKKVFRYLTRDQKSGGRLIGWYRSNTRPHREPEEDDREISRTFFGSDQKIFLFCDVSPDARVHATCILIQPSGAEVAFAFDPGPFTGLENLRAARRETPAQPIADGARPLEAPVPSALPAPRVEPSVLPPQLTGLESIQKSRREEPAGPVVDHAGSFEALLPPQARTPRRYISGANLRFVAAVVAAGAIAYYARGRVPTPASAPELARRSSESQVAVVQAADSNADDPLGLRAEYQGNALLLGWNRTSAQVNAATSGVFIIADGSKTRVLTLSPRELRNGGILYKPSADDINIELQVVEPRGQTTSQSIRVVGEPAPVSASASLGQIARRVLPQPPVPRSEARDRPVERFDVPPPPSSRIKQRSITTFDAPFINQQTTMPPPWFASALMPPPPQRATVESAPPTPAAQPHPTLIPSFTKPDADADTTAAAPAFQAATTIHAPQPVVPQGISFPQYAYDRPFEVKVEVSINTAGRVTHARLMDTVGPYASQLGPSALNTARAWTFHPATLGGQPVASTMVLTFRYSRPR